MPSPDTPTTLAPPPAVGPVRADIPTLSGRIVAILVAPGIDAGQVESAQTAIRRDGGHVDLVAPSLAAIETPRGSTLMPDGTFTTRSPLDYDAVVVPGGDVSRLRGDGAAVAFVARAYLHARPLGLVGAGAELLGGVPVRPGDAGVVHADGAGQAFVDALRAGIAARAPLPTAPGAVAPVTGPHSDDDLHRIAS